MHKVDKGDVMPPPSAKTKKDRWHNKQGNCCQGAASRQQVTATTIRPQTDSGT